MNSVIADIFNNRIKEDFCMDCNHKRKINANGCPLFDFKDAVCANFEWKSEETKKQWEHSAQRNRAITLWLMQHKTLEEIYKMTEPQLLSILTDKPKPVSTKPAPAESKPAPQKVFPKLTTQKYHFFYCQDKAGNQKVFKRNIATKTYEAEVKSFRKYLAKEGYVILKEEIKENKL